MEGLGLVLVGRQYSMQIPLYTSRERIKVNIWCNVLPESGVESIQSTIVQEARLSVYASLSIGLYVDSIHLIFFFPTPCYATKPPRRLKPSTQRPRPLQKVPQTL